ncbi:SDR family oxidoreductase [Pedosphaera parvula]|uniref:NAD-dependent epimerase/dehydratase n=1 Tax=Pedosphaera parvula (strain Ellin514) TaxID=320771 RepID=B9XAW6_PEDPL|nr:SDR family oxidoreductase [Pedosphaera parvula]EEF63151.1 NAD-dependent epimerase/dehydratase [Pedosphaera parvula Ellin514]
MTSYNDILSSLKKEPRTWLITGVAGFIGSNLLEMLLDAKQNVVGLDNFSTGKLQNLEEALRSVQPAEQKRFQFLAGDIRNLATCRHACEKVDYVLHQAALGSVPKSVEDPIGSNEINVTGFLNMLQAARENKVRRFVYATSSAVYGDSPELPKVESRLGNPLSPYAVTKLINEFYADVFTRTYGMETIGLRYFNVFGPRQDPEGPYAAVIPRWVAAMIKNEPTVIYGDGSTSRDFCFVANVVQANILAATTGNPEALGKVFNVALNSNISLMELFEMLRYKLVRTFPHLQDYKPRYLDFRPGDIRHSQADITKASDLLGYAPTHSVEEGLNTALDWYRRSVITDADERSGLNTSPTFVGA